VLELFRAVLKLLRSAGPMGWLGPLRRPDNRCGSAGSGCRFVNRSAKIGLVVEIAPVGSVADFGPLVVGRGPMRSPGRVHPVGSPYRV
jgi:hypothetical protein